jgi:hypothetical protein
LPPSIGTSAPVLKEARSEAGQLTVAATPVGLADPSDRDGGRDLDTDRRERDG